MTGEQVFVSHAKGDLQLVGELFSTVKNFPFGVHVALEEAGSAGSRARLEGRLANSDVVVAVFTERSADSAWINQEVGYALGRDIPVVPLSVHENLAGGFLAGAESVSLDRSDLTRTIFDLLCRLRDELEPLGAISVPNWYVRFPCTIPDCDHPVTLAIDHDQPKLWRLHQHGKMLEATCDVCEASYYFDPATIGFVRRERGV